MRRGALWARFLLFWAGMLIRVTATSAFRENHAGGGLSAVQSQSGLDRASGR